MWIFGKDSPKFFGLVDPYGAEVSSTKRQNSGAHSSSSSQNAIIEGTDAEFVTQVIEVSRSQPVLVDFWAPWCEPCRQLSPTLSQVVQDYKRPVQLVTINIDEQQAVAAQLQIRSLPTVYGFVAEQAIDGFMGNRPESELKAFIDSLWSKAESMGIGHGNSEEGDQLGQALALLEECRHEPAKEILEALLRENPQDITVRLSMALCVAMAGGTILDAGINQLGQQGPLDAKQRSLLSAATAWNELDQQAEAVTRIESHTSPMPDFQKAMKQWQQRQIEQSADTLFGIIGQHPEWDDERAKKTLLLVFQALSETHSVTKSGRKRLSALLFR